MAPSNKLWTVGCAFGASAVALGAFGAHGLKKSVSDPQKIRNWETAAQYQIFHSLALLLAVSTGNRLAAGCFAAGMVGFSGSLYGLVLTEGWGKVLGPVTPLGGMGLIAGWVLLARKGRV